MNIIKNLKDHKFYNQVVNDFYKVMNKNSIHWVEHWNRVYNNTLEIYNKIDWDVDFNIYDLATFALLHDSCRNTESHCNKHWELAAVKYSGIISDRILKAVAQHTIAMPKDWIKYSLFEKVCFDADRLDIARDWTGIYSVDEKYLFTDEAKDVLKERGKRISLF